MNKEQKEGDLGREAIVSCQPELNSVAGSDHEGICPICGKWFSSDVYQRTCKSCKIEQYRPY